MAIDIGLYFDLRNPEPWRQDPARLHAFTLEMCEEAEHLGAGSLWFTEHHLFDDGYCSQPLTFAAAAAARTSRVRLGTAIVIAPLHHPAQIAEQAALVDLISNGRLELGLGAGYRAPEYELYDVSLEQRYAQTDDRAREIRRLLGTGGVTPSPVQNPLPVWMGYQGPQGARRAGLLGSGLLSANAALYEPYRQGLVDGGHDPASARMAGGIQGWVSEDPERDWPLVSRHLAHQLDSYRRHMVEGTDAPVPKPVDPEQVRARDSTRGPIDRFSYGTAEAVASDVAQLTAGAPVETVFFWASLAGMPEDVVARNVQTICTKLLPLLRELGETEVGATTSSG
ncbi:LLM class flavin-dependent oxidoreductase [Nocardia sp. NBC_01388]|uniref:LLM class flavin-dependent oxidoreductase n=1 Tax=Nocardia sp. NBC_01388 TaxID=2903596 RepID=UPI00324BDC96